MRRLDKNIGFTIFEVLVASVVVSVIMLGVITASISLSNSARYYSASYYVSQTTQTTLNHVLNQSALAVGTPNKLGIVGATIVTDIRLPGGALISDPGTGDNSNNTFCIHQNLNTSDGINPPASAYDTLKNRWLCYTFDNASKSIHWCLKPYDISSPPGSSNYANDINNCRPRACTIAANNYVGNAFAKPTTILNLSNSDAGSGNQKANFQITINNCLDHSKSSCDPAQPLNTDNPRVVKTGSVSPAGHNT